MNKMNKMNKILGLLVFANLSMAEAATVVDYFENYSFASGTHTLGVASAGSVSTTSTLVSNVPTDYSLGTGVFSPESAGTVDTFSFNNNSSSGTITVATDSVTSITEVHIYGFLNSIVLSENFTLVSGWDVVQSGNTLTRSAAANGVGGATVAPGTSGNEGQAHATIRFDSAIAASSSFNITRAGSTGNDTVTVQFSGEVVPEPSSSLLIAIGGLFLITKRKRLPYKIN